MADYIYFTSNDKTSYFTAPELPNTDGCPYIYINQYTILGSQHLSLYAMPVPINQYITILYQNKIYGCQKEDTGANPKYYYYEYRYYTAEERAQGWVKYNSSLSYYEGDMGWGDVSTGPMYCVSSEGPTWANHDMINYSSKEIIKYASPAPILNNSVIGIKINSSQNNLSKGLNNIIVVNVEGVGTYDNTCAVALSGNNSTQTQIVKTTYGKNQYCLYTDEAENATELTITATATADNTITNSITLPIGAEIDTVDSNNIHTLLQGIVIGMKIKNNRG